MTHHAFVMEAACVYLRQSWISETTNRSQIDESTLLFWSGSIAACSSDDYCFHSLNIMTAAGYVENASVLDGGWLLASSRPGPKDSTVDRR